MRGGNEEGKDEEEEAGEVDNQIEEGGVEADSEGEWEEYDAIIFR